jgi:hypothetical protein
MRSRAQLPVPKKSGLPHRSDADRMQVIDVVADRDQSGAGATTQDVASAELGDAEPDVRHA